MYKKFFLFFFWLKFKIICRVTHRRIAAVILIKHIYLSLGKLKSCPLWKVLGCRDTLCVWSPINCDIVTNSSRNLAELIRSGPLILKLSRRIHYANFVNLRMPQHIIKFLFVCLIRQRLPRSLLQYHLPSPRHSRLHRLSFAF